MTVAIDGRHAASVPALLGALADAGADLDRLAAAIGPLDVSVDSNTTPDATRVRLTAEPSPPDHRTLGDATSVVDDLTLPDATADCARATLRLAARTRADADRPDTGATTPARPPGHLADVSLPVVGTDRGIAAVAGVALLVADLGGELVTTPLHLGLDAADPEGERFVLAAAERADWPLRPAPDRAAPDPLAVAVLAELADGVDSPPALDLNATGYGAPAEADDGVDGSRPLRALVGQRVGGGTASTAGEGTSRTAASRPSAPAPERRVVRDGGHPEVSVLETTLDDASPEVLGSLQETLPEAGAVDLAVIPTTGKRSRPGHLVRVVTQPANADEVAERLVRETGTLGVLESGAVHRSRTYSTVETVTIAVGDTEHAVDVKVTTDDDEDDDVVDVSAEYDDALAVARETGLPVRDVQRRAETAFHEQAADEREFGEGEPE